VREQRVQANRGCGHVPSRVQHRFQHGTGILHQRPSKLRTLPQVLLFPLSHHVMRRIVWERGAWLFLRRWGTYPKWWYRKTQQG